MTLKVYNTLTQHKEDFVPINPPKVGMYVCGVTVYDLSHIGHARATITFDVVYRYLKHIGYDVTYVRNFTDIDDKIIKRANELEITTGELTQKYIQAFSDDMAALRLQTPDLEPRCTEYVEKMIGFISTLVEKGHAYPTASGDVYYRVQSFKGYGKLSKRNLDDLEAGARVEINPEKESPMDFALWKGSKPGEPKWESPWGEGRPGWHIECSVMSTTNLGLSLDIHGGGKDLVFPHHENEIAQSEAYTGQEYAKYWLHNGFVNVPSQGDPGGTKMSKSLGNFYTIRDVLAAYHPETVKFFMLSTHYRNDVLFTEEQLNKAQARLSYLYETMAKADAFVAEHDGEGGQLIANSKAENVLSDFQAAMDDDFNTQRAFGQLSGVFKQLNELINKQEHPLPDRVVTIARLWEELRTVSEVLGVFTMQPQQFEQDLKLLRCKQLNIDPDEIENLIAQRNQARAEKDWSKADTIRDELAAKKVVIKDSKDGTSWTVQS